MVRSVSSQAGAIFFPQRPEARGEWRGDGDGPRRGRDDRAPHYSGVRFGFVDERLTHLGKGPCPDRRPGRATSRRGRNDPRASARRTGPGTYRGSRRGWPSPPTPWRPPRRPGRSRNPEGACCGGNLRTAGASRPASEPRPWGRDTSPAQLEVRRWRALRTPATAAAAGICSRSSSGFRTRWPRTA